MHGSLLDASTAAAFLARLGEHIEYNINIIDREGVIIASRDPTRVGDFHDAARQLVSSGASIERVEPGSGLPSGVRPGVNLPIVHKTETIGVVGITGDPDAVTALAYAVKTSLESMIELEAWKDKALRRQDRKNLLANLILYDDDAPRSTVESLARKLGYEPGLPRAPIILMPADGLEPTDALDSIKRGAWHGPQDMSFITSEGSILVFKSLAMGSDGLMTNFESQIESYVDAARRSIPAMHTASAYVGAVQSDLGRYREAYRQTLWLVSRFPMARGEPVCLFDHMFEYLTSRINRSELVAALDATLALLPMDIVSDMGASINALADSALNGKEAAARLGVHRNTLAARMDRITAALGRDPRNDPRMFDLLRLVIGYAQLKTS